MFSSTFLLVGKDMSLVSWEPETQVMFLLLESRIIPYFGARIHPGFSEGWGLGSLRVMPDGESLRGDAGRCAESRLNHRKCGQLRERKKIYGVI